MSAVKQVLFGGVTSSNYYDNQNPVHCDARQLLSPLFPNDDVSLSAEVEPHDGAASFCWSANLRTPSTAASWRSYS
jgi:hypothetical protein